MKRAASRRNIKVALRPQARKARKRKILSILAVFALGTVLALSWSRLKKSAFFIGGAISGSIPAPKTVVIEGAPESLKPEILSFLNSQNIHSWKNKSSDILGRFPFLESADLRRDFFSQSLVYRVVLRQAIAVFIEDGNSSFLDERGKLFKAPQDLYQNSIPKILDAKMDPKGLRRIAAFLKKVSSLPLPSPIESLRYRSPVNGWILSLNDGTRIDWGNFKWTDEKVRRLSAVMADAKTYVKGNFFVDMRSFSNGKIFVKPSMAKTL